MIIRKIDNLDQSIYLAKFLAKYLKKGDVVSLKGDLGTGKTTICKYLIHCLINNNIDVTSPTFNIVQIYSSDVTKIYHYDLYRIEDEQELVELAFEDAFQDGITLIEWPELILSLVKTQHIQLNLSLDANQQRLCEIDYTPDMKWVENIVS